MKYILILILILYPLLSMSQVVGEWKIDKPNYKWDEIYQYYGNELGYDIDISIEKYLIRESIILFIDNVSISFNDNNKVMIKTVEGTYFGIWEKHGSTFDIVVRINKTNVYFDLIYYDDLNPSLIVKSTNKDYIKIEENYLRDKIILKKIIPSL